MTYDYSRLKELSGVYLEDSYVLDIKEGEGFLLFVLEAVLTPENPEYTVPKPDEQYCYKECELVFEGISRAEWRRRTFREYRDASGEVDYGNIDQFVVYDDGYQLEGDWGSVRLWSDQTPRLLPRGTSRPGSGS